MNDKPENPFEAPFEVMSRALQLAQEVLGETEEDQA